MSESHSTETWEAIPGHPQCTASTCGRIRGPRGKALSLCMGSRGYLLASLWIRLEGRRIRRSYLAHRLIAAAFHGPCPVGKEVNHKNGNKTDNRPQNLEYVTKGENEHHAHVTGLKSHLGEKNPLARLTEQLVTECRERYAKGVSQAQMARELGISQPGLSLAIRGINWKHV